MSAVLIRVFITIVYIVVGLLTAIPISYFFQDDIFRVMSLTNYVLNASDLLLSSHNFGAWKVYKVTAIAMIIITVIIGNLFEGYYLKKKGK